MNDLIMRPVTGSEELELFNQTPYVLNDELADDLGTGRRRYDWLWMALRGDHVVARLAWWAARRDAPPFLLDVFDIDDTTPSGSDIGADLLLTASAKVLPAGTRPPDYRRFIPPDWRADALSHQVVERRMAALERTGARLFVERLRLQWNSGGPIRPPSGRLIFRPATDRPELTSLMALVLDGTLDAHSLRDLAHHTLASQAVDRPVPDLKPADRVAAHREAAHREAAQVEEAVREVPQGEMAQREVADLELVQREVAQREVAERGAARGAAEQIAAERRAAERVAAEQYDTEFLGYDSPREWWQIGTLPDGEPVGFVIPARNSYNAIIAYIGVVPAHRGHGYVDELLAEGTRILAAHDVPRIRASTDVGNVPMARAFQRAGYDNFERQINMTWDGESRRA